MKTNEVGRHSSIVKPPPSLTGVELRLLLHSNEPVTLVDVREAAPFHARHLRGSIHAPDSQTTGLVKKLQAIGRAVLVCDTGRQSALVTRTLGFCGFRSLAYLEGGIEAWAASGGRLVETTRAGFERDLPSAPAPAAPPKAPGLLTRLVSVIKQTV